jgi:outer membrane scaffolding protein for murein synthesis (MipA/OmpV family)
MQSYFGVTPAQAARSGYGVYRPSGGFKDVGVMAGISMPLSESWSVDLMAKYAHLLGDAADSPLVDLKGSANQFSAGLSLSYHF